MEAGHGFGVVLVEARAANAGSGGKAAYSRPPFLFAFDTDRRYNKSQMRKRRSGLPHVDVI
ncbi:hypothetical protein PACILC2_23230 [Paenibacillus cisolokensis]|uniref:Uncharacterized protein n=1 Tax=Paenibacillus cisolokensis TaxID=1658519 RepID=A0ABQ4N6G8_9BACL|nr:MULTISPECIES: hypothetical protein [Paenibacillus]GIQ63755.1 hypothetical protein PACILC2_23230 [Paenibacillus cisolokensis]